MIIENINASYKQWFRSLASTILLGVLIALLFTVHFFNTPFLGFTRPQIVMILIFIYLVFILIPIILKYQFIYISDENEKLSIKYYNIGFLPGKKKNIEFDLIEFHKFEIIKSVFDLRKSLVIYRKMKKGIAKYPPISLMGLKPVQRKQVTEMFTKLANK